MLGLKGFGFQNSNLTKHIHYRGNIKILQYLVEQKSIDIDAKDDQGCTPLILGAVYNNSVCVSLLLQGGATIFNCDKQGQNVLHKAAKEGSKDVIESIQNFLKAKEGKGKELEEVVSKGYMKKLMCKQDIRGNTPLMLALDSATTGTTLTILLEINKNLNLDMLNERNKLNETLMHRACRYNLKIHALNPEHY